MTLELDLRVHHKKVSATNNEMKVMMFTYIHTRLPACTHACPFCLKKKI